MPLLCFAQGAIFIDLYIPFLSILAKSLPLLCFAQGAKKFFHTLGKITRTYFSHDIILHTVLKETVPGAGIKSGLGWNLRCSLPKDAVQESTTVIKAAIKAI
ncbi:MAG: hypothetical protein J1E16_00725 [Muribaculaceae bacterium]|nr:hypothetical protein [Muribaculaceae bacterium]